MMPLEVQTRAPRRTHAQLGNRSGNLCISPRSLQPARLRFGLQKAAGHPVVAEAPRNLEPQSLSEPRADVDSAWRAFRDDVFDEISARYGKNRDQLQHASILARTYESWLSPGGSANDRYQRSTTALSR